MVTTMTTTYPDAHVDENQCLYVRIAFHFYCYLQNLALQEDIEQ